MITYLKNKQTLLLILILVFGLFLRIAFLGVPSLWVDEAISTTASLNILEKGIPLSDSGMIYDNAKFLHYLIAFFLFIIKSEFFARLISVIFGLLTIVLGFKIGNQYSKFGGIITALLLSVFYLQVFFSMQARYYQLFQLAFFATLYFLYLSKNKIRYLIFSLLSFVIAIDTHPEALLLGFFLIPHILYYNKKYWYAIIIPVIPIINKFLIVSGLSTKSPEVVTNYALNYLSYATNMYFLLILFIPGLIWAFFKKKELTLTLIIPSIVTLIGVFTLRFFAFRYIYFFVFPLILYSSLLMSFLYEKYGKLIIIPIILLIVIPSNLFFPYTYVTMLKPVEYQLNDPTAPQINLKDLPQNISQEIKQANITLISYFTPSVEYYLRKPDYALAFSMNGLGNDTISYNNSKGQLVDRYSGARILNQVPKETYYLTADKFSVSKLKPKQIEFHNNLTNNCSIPYQNPTIKIYYCE